MTISTSKAMIKNIKLKVKSTSIALSEKIVQMLTSLQKKTFQPFLLRKEELLQDSSERYFYYEVGIRKESKEYSGSIDVART